MNIVLLIFIISIILITIGIVRHTTPGCDINKKNIRLYSSNIYNNKILNN